MFKISSVGSLRALRSMVFRVGLWALAASFGMVEAYGACNPAQPPPEFYVGTDASCTHATLQAAIDAATCAYGTNIYLTHEVDYSGAHVTINNKRVALIGRDSAATCGPATPPICDGVCVPISSPLVALNAQDGSGHTIGGSVLTITGNSSVTLRYLDIVNASNSGNGGAVNFDAIGQLALDTTWLRNNSAANGGAIAFNGQSASTLTIGANVQISTNRAEGNGGGIAATGGATVNVLGPDAVIEENLAPNGDGGGLYIEAPAITNIGSANHSLPVLFQNQAKYGGGLALLTTGSEGNTHAQLFTTDPLRPVEISSNQASHTGGGIYLQPYSSVVNTGNAIVCAYDLRLSDNTAANGGAIYGDASSSAFGDIGSLFYINTCGYHDWQSPTELGGVACTDQVHCNSIDGNVATDPDAAVILMQTSGNFVANRFSFVGNRGDYGLRTIDDGNQVTLDTCLFANNQTAHELIDATGSTDLNIQDCTFANDLIDAAHVIYNSSKVYIITSLFYELGTLTLDYTGSITNIYVNYVVSNDISTLPSSDAVIQAQAHFVDLAHGDFHLAPDSPGVDFSYGRNDIAGLSSTDRDGVPRDVDLPSVVNVNGPRDVGAFERQNLFVNCGRADSLFCNSFEF